MQFLLQPWQYGKFSTVLNATYKSPRNAVGSYTALLKEVVRKKCMPTISSLNTGERKEMLYLLIREQK